MYACILLLVNSTPLEFAPQTWTLMYLHFVKYMLAEDLLKLRSYQLTVHIYLCLDNANLA